MNLSGAEKVVRREVGVRLFTVLARLPHRRVLHRPHTSHPEWYAVGGEKSAEVATEWLRLCIHHQLPYFGTNSTAVREVFADHGPIAELGCGAVINVPVVSDSGTTLGAFALLDAEGAYRTSHVDVAAGLTGLAVPALSGIAFHLDTQEESHS